MDSFLDLVLSMKKTCSKNISNPSYIDLFLIGNASFYQSTGTICTGLYFSAASANGLKSKLCEQRVVPNTHAKHFTENTNISILQKRFR